MIVRDPVHGDIELGRLEQATLNCEAIQRLRGVKQLGTAYLVYPGAVHTRFDHSLGTCAISHRIVAALRREGVEIPSDLEDVIGVGALLHDVTHIPFGHTLEDERRLFDRHDKGTRLSTLMSGPLGESLGRLGIRESVEGLIGEGPSSVPTWAREVISSTIDADLLDYLKRDSYFAGLSQDYDDRVFHYFCVADEHLALRMSRRGMDRADARSEVIQLLRMRYFLTERVYYHHTKVVAGAMISKAVELALDRGVLTEARLLEFNDWTLLDHLVRSGIPAIAALIGRLQRRELLKRGYVISSATIGPDRRAELVRRYHSSRVERGKAEQEIAATLHCAPEEVIVYCPALTVMKEAGAWIETSRGLRLLNDAGASAFSEIRALEAQYESLWRMYVFVPAGMPGAAMAAATDFFGYPSEYAARS